MTDTPTFAEWVILELLGHRRLAGYLTEQQIAGHGFLRLDIPTGDGEAFAATDVTQLFNPSSVYAIHPTSETIARHAALTYRQAPLNRWELPAAPKTTPIDDGDDDEDEDVDDIALDYDDVLDGMQDGDTFQ